MSGNSNSPQLRAAPLITSAAMIGAGTLVARVAYTAGASAWQNGSQASVASAP
jgi:hypothetical protein